MKKLLLILLVAVFSAGASFAEFDDDILIRTGDFSMHIGWGLSYKPESIDKNKTIFPLLMCVQKNYSELKSIKRDFRAELFYSKTNPQGVELVVWEGDSSNRYNCKDEDGCVNVLENLVSHLTPQKKPLKNQEELTLYLVMKKQEYENEKDWRLEGEFLRHILSYNLTKDKYFYAMYFSLEEAEKQAKKNPLSKIKKVVCTKETISCLDINWDTILETSLASADEKLSELYGNFTSDKITLQIVEKLNADFTDKESKAVADYVRLKNFALEDAISLENGIYFLSYEVRVDFNDEKKRSKLQDSLLDSPVRYYVILTYDTAHKMILNLETRTNNYTPLNFIRKAFEKTTVLYCIENFSREGSNLTDKRLFVIDAFTFESLATEIILYSDEMFGISFKKDYDFYSDHLSVGGGDFDFKNSKKFSCEKEYYFGLHHTFVVERRSDRIEKDERPRWWATLIRGDGTWNLRLPLADDEAKNLVPPQFTETEEGFSLSFSWGGGAWFHQDTFFFRDEEDEPVLYKVQGNTDEYGRTKDGDFVLIEQYPELAEINPPIKISSLGTNKILNLFSGGYERLPKVTCNDSDYDKPIKDKIMHLEVRKDGNLIQNLEYVYEADIHPEKKHFELVDLNFDGFDDILILGGYTMKGVQPYYDAYLWNSHEERYDFNPPCWEDVCTLYVECDEINRLFYSSENTTHGLIYHYIYEYDDSNQKYNLTGTLYYNYPTDYYSENEKYNHWSEDWDLKDPSVVEFEDLPEHWKRALKHNYIIFKFL